MLLTTTMLSALSCGEKKAQLPEYKIGNQWIFKMESKGLIYEVTIDITDIDIIDSKDCYVSVQRFQPALDGVVTYAYIWIDRATSLPVRGQATGTMMGAPYSSVLDYSYLFPDQKWWPLEVGKEIEISETLHRTIKALGLENKETERKNSTYEVVRTQEITVLAGTFKCFKIVEHDETGMRLSETWYSDEVKTDIKSINYKEEYTIELKSYSL